MKVVAEFSVVPIGVGVSLSDYIAECERILEESGLSYQLHANGTNVEGDWDQVFEAIKACHTRLHALGVPRLNTNIKVGTRTDREPGMEAMVSSVQSKLRPG